MNVSIIIPSHKPDKKIMGDILKSLKNQVFDGKYELIVENIGGLAQNINSGIRKAKNNIIITLHQDCIPVGKNWIKDLTAPLKQKENVASVSDVELPKKLWETFDPVAKILSLKEQNIITPLLDEKGCAYKKDALKSVGLFDEKTFRTAGEDFDIYLKLTKIGKIVYPHTKVIHHNYYSAKSRMKKEYQLANGFGALVKKYGRKLPGWYLGFLKATPLIGWPLFFRGSSLRRLRIFYLIAPLIFLVAHFLYIKGFWKGFLNSAQTI